MAHEDKKDVNIIVNGQEKTVSKDEISYEDVVILAFGALPGEQVRVTVTYTRGHGDKPEGSLVAGQTAKVKAGMIFNVTASDRS